jgi:hypothetical protein
MISNNVLCVGRLFAVSIVFALVCAVITVSAQMPRSRGGVWHPGNQTNAIKSTSGQTGKQATAKTASRGKAKKPASAKQETAKAPKAEAPKGQTASAAKVDAAKTQTAGEQPKASNLPATTVGTKAEQPPARAAKSDVSKEQSKTGPCDRDAEKRTDLSGTYAGRVNYPNGGLSGDATLRITRNQFILTTGNAAETGRITAITTCKYTAVTMMFGELKESEPGQPPPPPLPVISLTANRQGKELMLQSLPSEKRSFSFETSGVKVSKTTSP